MDRFFLQKRNGLLSSLCCHTQREESNPLGEITLELRLVFQIPESGLTINGLIGGLKQSVWSDSPGDSRESDESRGTAADRRDGPQ
jgi:hypothetical protein